jgi:phage terminase large subunit
MLVPCPSSPDGSHAFTTSSSCDHCGRGAIIANGEVLYVPTDKGLEYHSRTEPNVLLWGGRGSGKSTIGRWDAHMRALAHPGFTYIILRRNFPELQKSHLIHVPREMKLLGGTFNYTDKIAKYPNGSKGFFSHCATEEDVLNLLSAEFALAFFDELSTFEWEMFTKLAASVRVPVGSGLTAMVRAATNPLGPSAQQVLKYFVDKTVTPEEDPEYNPNDWFNIKANLADNPHLDRDQYRKRFSGLAAHVYKAWVDGDFVLENALFNLIPQIEGKPWHVINDLDFPRVLKAATIYRTVDAGWFPDPTVILWIAHLGNRHIVFHEKTLYKHTAADTAEVIKDEDRKLARKVSEDFVLRVAMTYCDPSMDINTQADVRTIKDIYEDNGIAMECSINNREHFATVMHQALAEQADENTPRIQFYVNGREGCPLLVKTIPQMRYNEKRLKAMDDHREDHWVVAACYYLMSHSADSRNEFMQQGKVRPWMKEKTPRRFILGSDQINNP